MESPSLIIGKDVFYQSVLDDIKKSRDPLQPIFEAFTNSLEGIKQSSITLGQGEIIVSIYFDKGLMEDERIFHRIVIEDNGIGFDDDNFDRLKRLKDNRKGFCNRGAGRVQFLHSFDKADYHSVYQHDGAFKERHFTLSKRWIQKNAIISHHKPIPCDSKQPRTVLTLSGLLEEKDHYVYNNLYASKLKDAIINRYLLDFCTHRDTFPNIQINEFVEEKLGHGEQILREDIPNLDKESKFSIRYHKVSSDGSELIPAETKEPLKLTCFKVKAEHLESNGVKLTCKGEVVNEPEIQLTSIQKKDAPDGYRFLFLVSGDCLDKRDNDSRGALKISSREEFLKDKTNTDNLFGTEDIFLDDIQEEINDSVISLYPEIKAVAENKKVEIDLLKNMFLLSEETLSTLTIKLNDTEESILRRVYTADIKTIARKDIDIKNSIDKLKSLDPTSKDYREKLNFLCDEVVNAIPQQNRTSLVHYVARRKLVLEIFGQILDNELKIQEDKSRNIDESLLHNIIFQQSTTNPKDSDLWLINEDFIHFKGASEFRLQDVQIDGKSLFKETFAAHEEEYLRSLGENRKVKRPDILLFPDEGKCIIIEMKNPDVNVSEHLNQINKYAYLIRNYSEELFHLETFYGYLIGEKILAADVRSADSDYREAYHFGYLFRPHKTILGIDGRRDGSLYSEVIQYSTLLERAMRRNEIFIEKLTNVHKPSPSTKKKP